MTSRLRAILTLLVLLCMAFVQITGVVDWSWLGPLYALTAAAPWLAPHNQRSALRLAWNGGVFFIFAVLVHDATKSGANHMLEDGLILAAFCQVHLLNNLGRKQSPDLLFFNSFLIVLVSCFFSDSLALILLFVPWAALQIAAMQLAALVRDGRELPRSTARWLVRSSLQRAAIALGLCALAFVVLPRDFAREGFAARFLKRSGADAIGFQGDEIRLGFNRVSNIERAVLRITRRSPGTAWPEYWRGATMSRLDGDRWRARSSVRTRYIPGDTRFKARRLGSWRAVPTRQATGAFEVEVLDPLGRRIFLPAQTTRFRIDPTMESERVNVRGDRSVTYERRRDLSDEFRYELGVSSARRRLGGRPRPNAALAPYALLYDDALLTRGAALVRELGGGMRADEAQHSFVERLRLALSQRQDYALPGEDGAAVSLAHFLDGAKGHCELFASALAIALRSESIPCRLVTGFRVDPTENRDTLLVKSKQAHAWVEVWDPRGGWYAVDATPAANSARGADERSWFTAWTESLQDAWKGIVGLDAEAQARALAFLRALPLRIARSPWTHPGRFAAALALLVALVLVVRRRRPRRPEAVVAYESAVRATGMSREASETPHEFLHRARASGLDEKKALTLARATEAHERARYTPT